MTNMLEAMMSMAFIGNLGWPELLVLGIIGVLIFGRRLPEVGKNIGKGIVEFKRGLSGIEDDANDAVGTGDNQPRLNEHKGGQTLDLGEGQQADAGNPQKEQNG